MSTYQNPILKGYADPDVLYDKGVYYMYATSYHIKYGYEVYASTDLVNWENKGNCIEDAWGKTKNFWAPDVKEYNGKYYMLASVDEHLGLMIADSPTGPFVPQDKFLYVSTIDGHILFEDGKMYIYYVSWRDDHEYGIYACEMEDDFITPKEETEVLVIRPEHSYELDMGRVTEAPYMMKKDGVYYLTYSASHFESPHYCVCYATSKSPLGPFTKYEGNPILVGDTERISGIGHHCIVYTPKGDTYIMYHTHDAPGKIHPRNLSLSKIAFEGDKLVCEDPFKKEYDLPIV